jgi:hypothetical protein
MMLALSWIVFGALAVDAYFIIYSVVNLGVTYSEAFNNISLIRLTSLTSPSLSTKKDIPTWRDRLLIDSDSVAITFQVSIIPFYKLIFDSLKSFILALTNLATASKICAGGYCSLIYSFNLSKAAILSCHLASSKPETSPKNSFTLSMASSLLKPAPSSSS